jgi:PTH1 family peptidyl-tRNA hydrolase
VPFWSRRSGPETGGDLHLVVGLGNPGGRYADTRHNVGFMVVNVLLQRYGMRLSGSKQRADVARGSIEGVPVLLAQPQTYMNESGRAVVALTQYYRISLDRLLIVCDDIDLPFGTLRLRPDGSSGGQRGLKSVIDSLGTDEFARLRIGVGRPARDAVPHVLGRFTADQSRMLPALIDIAADAVVSVLVADIHSAMNRFNRNWLDAVEAGQS